MIIALDVDGTLFDGHSVDPEAVDTIEAAAADGHVAVIVSGRPWRDLQRIIPDVLRSTSIAVCEHGAVLVEVATGTVHHLAPPVDPAVAAIISASNGDVMGDEKGDEIVHEMVVYEATIGLPASARELAEAACARVGGCYVVGNKGSIAIVPNGCDKGTGLARAIELLDMSDRALMAIGDATNDLPMFAMADVAVAVANAEPALAETGIEVTRRAFGAGVAEALARHVLVSID
jgi:HAD superfamily hydrolase (TIGR01484 family)